MNKKGHTIKSVDSGSIADALELQPGDRLLSVNGNEIEEMCIRDRKKVTRYFKIHPPITE